jgi:hypothetical protein
VFVVRMPDRQISTTLLIELGSVVALVATVTTFVFWKKLMRNQSSRRLVGILLLYVFAMVVHRVFAHVSATAPRTVLRDDMLLGAVLIGAAALTQFRWTAWLAAILLAGSAVATAWPARTPAIFGLTTLATIVVAMAMWLRVGGNEA